jgi:hypothetical protein
MSSTRPVCMPYPGLHRNRRRISGSVSRNYRPYRDFLGALGDSGTKIYGKTEHSPAGDSLGFGTGSALILMQFAVVPHRMNENCGDPALPIHGDRMVPFPFIRFETPARHASCDEFVVLTSSTLQAHHSSTSAIVEPIPIFPSSSPRYPSRAPTCTTMPRTDNTRTDWK